jgi:hypothetical protein
MAFSLAPFADAGLNEALLELVIDEHRTQRLARLTKWWAYFRNASRAGWGPGEVHGGGGSKGLAQEAGLPARLTGRASAAVDDRALTRREIVIENDIAWRIQTMVDFMFGKPVRIESTAPDAGRAALIGQVLDAVWEASGGISLLQDMALLGHVHGHVDLLLRADGLAPGRADGASILERAGELRIEVVEPTRGIPILDPNDYREIRAYVIHFERTMNEAEREGVAKRIVRSTIGRRDATPSRRRSEVIEIISATHHQRYEDGALVESRPIRPGVGRVPVVHIQNLGQPFRYEGLGEVEPLVPLQDELNTRLSDRASRVTMQSFKMYLAKGIEGFGSVPVGPGQIWSTDNTEAEVIAFGGDASSPSEQTHIEQVREALDKVSGVPPLASGVVRARIGNLSSATALRVTLMGLIAKTMRKRVTYGRGISEMSRMVLDTLDAAGVFETSPDERGVRLEWPDPVPVDVRDRVFEARAKADLGVPEDRVLAELGEGEGDAGVT